RRENAALSIVGSSARTTPRSYRYGCVGRRIRTRVPYTSKSTARIRRSGAGAGAANPVSPVRCRILACTVSPLYVHPENPNIISVPHPRKDLGKGLVGNLRKIAGLK